MTRPIQGFLHDCHPTSQLLHLLIQLPPPAPHTTPHLTQVRHSVWPCCAAPMPNRSCNCNSAQHAQSMLTFEYDRCWRKGYKLGRLATSHRVVCKYTQKEVVSVRATWRFRSPGKQWWLQQQPGPGSCCAPPPSSAPAPPHSHTLTPTHQSHNITSV